MYLWKYWRESRITFAAGMVLIGLLLWAMLKVRVGFGGSPDTAQIFALTGAILTLPLGFMGLRFGSFGVGRDLGEGSGAYLFTRPRPRAFFVWNDWGFGMAQMLALIIAVNAVLLLGSHRLAAAGAPSAEPSPFSVLSVFSVHCVAGLLLAGLLFGLTYFCSVALKNRGVLLAIGILVGYEIGKSVVKHYWPAITLPDITLTEFSLHNVTTQHLSNGGVITERYTAAIGFANHLGLEIAVRTLIMMVFPVAAYALMEARDVE